MHELLQEAKVPSKIILDSAIGYTYNMYTVVHYFYFIISYFHLFVQFHNGACGSGDSGSRGCG